MDIHAGSKTQGVPLKCTLLLSHGRPMEEDSIVSGGSGWRGPVYPSDLLFTLESELLSSWLVKHLLVSGYNGHRDRRQEQWPFLGLLL